RSTGESLALASAIPVVHRDGVACFERLRESAHILRGARRLFTVRRLAVPIEPPVALGDERFPVAAKRADRQRVEKLVGKDAAANPPRRPRIAVIDGNVAKLLGPLSTHIPASWADFENREVLSDLLAHGAESLRHQPREDAAQLRAGVEVAVASE